MRTNTDCPSCGRRLRLPEHLAGAPVQCPSCGRTFTAAAAEVELEPQQEDETSSGSGARPAAGWHVQMSLDDDDRPRPIRGVPPPPPPLRVVPVGPAESTEAFPNEPLLRRDWEPHWGTGILVLGIVSVLTLALCPLIGLPCGLAAWQMGHHDIRKMEARRMDPDGLRLTQTGMVCGIIGTILNSLVILGCGFIMLAMT